MSAGLGALIVGSFEACIGCFENEAARILGLVATAFDFESLAVEICLEYAGRGIDASGTVFSINFELAGGTFEVSGRGCYIAINLVAIGS